MVDFDYDQRKSETNQDKHGIDFETARRVCDDPRGVDVPARSDTEPRVARIGFIDGKLWSVFFTPRGNVIRIISARRARQTEARLYDT